MLLNFKAETKSLRPRPKGPEAKAEPRGYEVEIEANAKILALRPVWPRGFNISAAKLCDQVGFSAIRSLRLCAKLLRK